MNKLKKRLITALLCIPLLFVPQQKASAIFGIGDVVFDPTAAANAITQFIETVFEYGEEIEALISQVKNTSDILQNAKSVYNKISPFLQKAAAYTEVIAEIDRLMDDYNRVSSLVSSLSTDKNWSVARVNRYYQVLKKVSEDVIYDVDFVKSILDVNNSLTQVEREEKLAEMKEKFGRYRSIIDNFIEEDVEDMSELYHAAGEDYAMKRNLRLGGNEKLDVAVKIDWSDPATLREIDRISKQSDGSHAGGSLNTGGNLAENLCSIVQLVIAIMMACFMVINWYRRNKGELQHQDALQKVFFGGMASLIILQCIKLCLFDSGLANL